MIACESSLSRPAALFAPALLLAACGGGGGGPQAAAPPAGGQPPAMSSLAAGPPTALAARADSLSALLAWEPPAAPLSGYTVYRGDGDGCENLAALPMAVAPTASTAIDTVPGAGLGGTLTAGDTYCYRVSASNGAGEGARSATAVVTVENPGAPTGLAVVSASAQEIVLAWGAPGAGAGGGPLDGYNVFRCAGQACSPLSESHAWVPLADGERYRDGDVTARTVYRYAVGAARLDTRGDWSNEVSAAANAAPGFPDAAAIGALVFVAGAAIASLRLPRASGGDVDPSFNDGALSDYSLDPALPGGLVFDRFTGVLSGTPVSASSATEYTLWAHDDDSDYGRADAATVTLTLTIRVAAGSDPAVSAPPMSPAALAAWANPARVRLAWEPPASPLSGYTVYRSAGDGCEGLAALPMAVASTATMAEDTVASGGLVAGDTYCYRVAASNGAGEGARSATAAVTVTAVDSPTNVAVASASAQEIVLTWDPPDDDGGGPVERYNVYRCTRDPGSACADSNVEVQVGDRIGSVDPPLTRYVDPVSTAAGTVFTYVVAAERLGWGSNWEYLRNVVANAAPGFPEGAAIGELVFVAGAAIAPLRLPRASGGDIDASINDGALSDYSFDPPALPDGLAFDRLTGVLSGTPVGSSATEYTLWAHDDDDDYTPGDADSLSFTITVR